MLLRLIPFLFVLLWASGFVGARLGLQYAEPATLLVVSRWNLLGHFIGDACRIEFLIGGDSTDFNRPDFGGHGSRALSVFAVVGFSAGIARYQLGAFWQDGLANRSAQNACNYAVPNGAGGDHIRHLVPKTFLPWGGYGGWCYGAVSRRSVASVFYLVPPVTALQAWLMFGESFDTKAMVGFLLVAAVAVYLVVRKPKKVKNESVKSHSYLTE